MKLLSIMKSADYHKKSLIPPKTTWEHSQEMYFLIVRHEAIKSHALRSFKLEH